MKKFKCDTCNHEHYYYIEEKESNSKCFNIGCKQYGYNVDYTHEQLTKLKELRDEYIGMAIHCHGDVFVVLDVLDLNNVVFIDIAGFIFHAVSFDTLRLILKSER